MSEFQQMSKLVIYNLPISLFDSLHFVKGQDPGALSQK